MTETKKIVGVYLCGKNYFKQPAHHMAVPVNDETARLSDSDFFRQSVIETCCAELADYLNKDMKDPK